ncbi:MAG: hypothetical protein QXP59_04970 [Saccharolobus sp.]
MLMTPRKEKRLLHITAANQSITKALKMANPGHDLPFKVSESEIEELPNDMKISILLFLTN